MQNSGLPPLYLKLGLSWVEVLLSQQPGFKQGWKLDWVLVLLRLGCTAQYPVASAGIANIQCT